MNAQHLSDEAVAAYADGVLRGHARERAARHTEACAECRSAVRSQREAVLALRSAPAPSLPSGLFERLQAVPSTTPLQCLPTALAADGSTVLRTSFAPLAAFVPVAPAPAPRSALRGHPFVTGAAVLALAAGALTAVGGSDAALTPRGDTVTTRVDGTDRAPVEPRFLVVRFAHR